jgi:cytoskeleton protein RodZ
LSQPITMGAYLRAARRKRRVSIERAAEDTRIRADFLMRMESDEFDFLAPAYVRGFLKTYARFLRVDPEPLLEEFDNRYGTGRVNTAQILAHDRSTKAPKERRPLSSWTMAAALAAVGLLTLFVIGLVSGPDDEPAARVALDKGAAPSPSNEARPSPSAASTAPSPSVSSEPDDASIALDNGMDVEITAATGRCWVEVQSDGVPDFRGTLEIGDVQIVHADSEMSIVLGNAAGVELSVNGHNLGAPGGAGVLVIHLPQDIKSLVRG